MPDDETLKPGGAEEFVAPETGAEIPEAWDSDQEYQRKMQERLKTAEGRGERVIEIPVTLSFTIKIPQDDILCEVYEGGGSVVGNMVYYQSNGIVSNDKVRGIIYEKLKEQYPELIEDRNEMSKISHEIASMIRMVGVKQDHGETGPYHYVKTETYDPERARDMVHRYREIAEKHHYSRDDLSAAIKHFEELGDKID